MKYGHHRQNHHLPTTTSNTKCVEAPLRGFDLHLVFATRYVLFVLLAFHMKILTNLHAFFWFHMKYAHKVSPSHFIMHFFDFIWNHLTNEMILLPRCFCTAGQGGGWAMETSNTKCVEAPRRGSDLHLVFATRYVVFFAYISYENTNTLHFTRISISYEIHGKSNPFYFSAYSIWHFILISSCLFSISLFALTQQYFVRSGGVLMFGGSL